MFIRELNFKVGSSGNSFPVVVINDSNQFASFQIELIAAGANTPEINYEWYTISPDVSVKIPPGDLVEFMVSITETPIAGFSGIMNITVRAFSIELRQENREILRINLQQGAGRSLIKLEIPSQKLQGIPLDIVEIPILISNPSQQNTNVTLSCLDLPESWFLRGNTQQFQLKPGAQLTASFICTLPFDQDAIAKVYPFTINSTHTNGLPSQLQGNLEVLPKGSLLLSFSSKLQIIPAKKSWKFWGEFWASSPAIFDLTAENNSNLSQQVDFDVENVNSKNYEDFSFEVIPNNIEVAPFSKEYLTLEINKARPWLGQAKKLNLLVKANWQDARVNTIDELQAIEVIIKPIVSTGVLIFLFLLGICLFGWLSDFNPDNPFPPHKSMVTSIQYDGSGNKVLSSSNDRTIRQWNVAGLYQPFTSYDLGILTETKKAIRTIRYRPVNNDLVAAGLENGEIQILDAQSSNKRLLAAFSSQNDDRVFGLEYTLDGRNLFSGHGSGTVLRWDLQNLFTNPPTQPSQTKKFDFAINAIALVGQDDSTLAIAGRYNQIVLWNWVNNTVKTIPYPVRGGQDDYIQSINAPDRKRNLLATADNQGYIAVWDLSTCLQSDRPCQLIEGWQDAHHGKAVRSVAFSSQGCYLVSGGDDGETKIWTLNPNGKRTASDINGKSLQKTNSPVSSVAIHLAPKDILVLSGTNEGRVLAQKTERLPKLGCDLD